MKHLNYFLGLAIALLSFTWAGAETVSPYTVDFNEAISTTSGFKVAPGWKHITATGAPTYTYYATAGVDGTGCLYGGSHTANAYDLLVTPAITGSFTIQVKAYNSSANIRIFDIDEDEYGTLTRGEVLVNESPANDAAWHEYKISNAKGKRLGIRMHYVYIDNIEAESADVVLEPALTVNSATNTTVGGGSPLCDTNNNFTISATAKVTNTGERTLIAGEDGYSVSLTGVHYASGYVPNGYIIATQPIEVDLAVGESTEVSLSATISYSDFIDGFDGSTRNRVDVMDNFTKSRQMVAWFEPTPYQPELTVRYNDAGQSSGFAIAFGNQTQATTKSIILRNSGAAPLTATITAPDGFSVSQSSISLEADASTTVDITMGTDTYGIKSGNLTISGEGIDDFIIALSGTTLDPNKFYEDFESNKGKSDLPSGWIAPSGGWSKTTYTSPTYNNYAEASYVAENKLITPLLHVTAGEKMSYEAKARTASSFVKVYYSADRTNWTEIPSAAVSSSASTINTSAFTTIVVDGVPEGDYYIAFGSGYAQIDNVYGFETVEVAHDVMITASSIPAKSSVNKPFKASASLKNVAATAEEALAVNLYFGDNIVATKSFDGLAAGGSIDAELSFVPTEGGTYQAHIEVAFNDGETLATEAQEVEISNKFFEDFESSTSIPAGWLAPDGGITISSTNGNHYAQNSSTTDEYKLVTPLLKVAEGETATVDVYVNVASQTKINIYYSTDRANWVQAGSTHTYSTGWTWTTQEISGIPAGEYYIAFGITRAYIDNVNGFELVPVAHDLAITESSFPAITSVGKTFKTSATVKNVGANDETGYTANLYVGEDLKATATSNAVIASAATSTIELSFEPTEEFDGKAHIEFVFANEDDDDYVLSTPEADVIITKKFYENFDDVTAIPEGWLDANNQWSISAGAAKALGPNDSYMYKLITPLLKVEEGEVMTFKAIKGGSATALKAYYSADRKEWIELLSLVANDMSDTYTQYTLEGIPAGNYYIAFESGGASIDDVHGFELVSVDHDVAILATSIPANGKANAEYKATATVKNVNTKAEGAYTATLYFGEEAVATFEGESIEAGASATAEFSFIPNAAGEHEAKVVFNFADNYSIESAVTTVTISEEVAESEVVVGTDSKTTNKSYGPMDAYYKNSETETIYTAEDLGISAGNKITSISWNGYNAETSKEVTATFSIWIENSELTSEAIPTASAGLSTDGMTQIYAGSYTVAKGGSASNHISLISVNLAQPFEYTGNSLRIVVRHENADQWSSNIFFEVDSKTTQSAGRGHDTNSSLYTSSFSRRNMPVLHLGVQAEPTSYSGKVVDGEGNAIEGATVTLKAVAAEAPAGISARRLPAGSDAVQYEAVTDANGEFSVNVIQTATPYEVTVAAEGYKSLTLDETVDLSNGNVTLSENIVLEKETVLYSIEVVARGNGYAEADKAQAAEGDIVTITITADEGYSLDGDIILSLDEITIPVDDDDPIDSGYADAPRRALAPTVTKIDDTHYSFAMPATNVTVYANFTQKTTGISAVDASGKAVESIRYINPAGQVSDHAHDGINIVVTRYTDGTQKTTKVVY